MNKGEIKQKLINIVEISKEFRDKHIFNSNIPADYFKMANHLLLIGFNCGVVCLDMLMSNTYSEIVIVDNTKYLYTLQCFNTLDKLFPGRLKFYIGNSVEICSNELLPLYPNHFDATYINNECDIRELNINFFLSRDMSVNDGYIIYDNINTGFEFIQLWEGYKKDKYIKEISNTLPSLIGQYHKYDCEEKK